MGAQTGGYDAVKGAVIILDDATAVEVRAGLDGRDCLIVQNDSANSVYLHHNTTDMSDAAEAATKAGMRLTPGMIVGLDLGVAAHWYAIASADDTTLRVTECG